MACGGARSGVVLLLGRSCALMAWQNGNTFHWDERIKQINNRSSLQAMSVTSRYLGNRKRLAESRLPTMNGTVQFSGSGPEEMLRVWAIG